MNQCDFVGENLRVIWIVVEFDRVFDLGRQVPGCEAADAAEVRGLVESDPFWPTGLRKSIQILEWTQVYANGQKMI